MIAMTVNMGTKYDCNVHYEGNHIWLQFWSKQGLNMMAIAVPNRALYHCNLFRNGSKMIAMLKFA